MGRDFAVAVILKPQVITGLFTVLSVFGRDIHTLDIYGPEVCKSTLHTG